jgi:hypothetical protein
MPIDHLFSLLEDEFERQDIEGVIDDELSIKGSDQDKLKYCLDKTSFHNH